MTQIDWSKARKGFDFHFKGKAAKDAGDFYFISPLNDRFVSEAGRYILFRDMKDLPELFEISMRPDDSTWNGEGLPPVGTVCEYKPYQFSDDWRLVEIIAHFCNKAMVAAFIPAGKGAKHVDQAIAECFRPIRTAAQLAAEEREKAIEFMMQMTSSLGHSDVSKKILFGELYDKGLRFEVKP